MNNRRNEPKKEKTPMPLQNDNFLVEVAFPLCGTLLVSYQGRTGFFFLLSHIYSIFSPSKVIETLSLMISTQVFVRLSFLRWRDIRRLSMFLLEILDNERQKNWFLKQGWNRNYEKCVELYSGFTTMQICIRKRWSHCARFSTAKPDEQMTEEKVTRQVKKYQNGFSQEWKKCCALFVCVCVPCLDLSLSLVFASTTISRRVETSE